MWFFRNTIEEERVRCELDNLRLQCQVYLNELIKATNKLNKPASYEYRHLANNQFSKIKDSIVELMNEGWERVGEIEKNKEECGYITEYSQIMRRIKP